MKEIGLTQNQVTLVDDEDFEKLNQWKWYAVKQAKTFYAVRHSSSINGERYTICMHWEIIGKPPKGFVNDHRNGQGLDNQRHNLRHVTRRQNGQNLQNIKKSSQYPGVSWAKHRQKWSAQITINGINKHLGLFAIEVDAFEVYRDAVYALGETMNEEYQIG